MAKSKQQLAKEKAWKNFSLYIRRRDCLKSTFTLTEGECVTCKRVYPIGQLQAGHFVPGRTNAVLFDEQGVHAQCYGCNVGKGGAYHDYWLFMEKRYGRKVIDRLLEQRHVNLTLKEADFLEIAEKYKKKAEALHE